MKTYSRKDRVSAEVLRILAELIRLELKDPRVGLITLTDVELTPDYAHAKVFFTSLRGQENLPEIQAGLKRAAGFLRRELGRRIHIHTLPELHFVFDASVEHGMELSKLIEHAVASDEARNSGESGEESRESRVEGGE